MRIRFTKMHGLGNDFVVLDAINQAFVPDAAHRLGRERDALAHPVQHDEVVALALHLGELEPHAAIFAYRARARPAAAS